MLQKSPSREEKSQQKVSLSSKKYPFAECWNSRCQEYFTKWKVAAVWRETRVLLAVFYYVLSIYFWAGGHSVVCQHWWKSKDINRGRFSPPGRCQSSNSGQQPWQRAPLPAKPACWPNEGCYRICLAIEYCVKDATQTVLELVVWLRLAPSPQSSFLCTPSAVTASI